MKTWLLDHLIRAGHITETGLTRRARIRTCNTRHCRTQVLTGLDNDTCAFEARCDPQPLSALGEALAHLDGRHTWTLRKEGPGFVLDPRDAHQITWAPAGTRTRQDVLATHICGRPIPEAWTAPTSFPEIKPPLPANSVPPF